MHTIERQVLLRAPRSRVWHALTDVKKFCEWFGVTGADGEFKPGATVHINAQQQYGGDFDMMIEQMEPEHLFTWRWHPGAHDPLLDFSKESTTLVELKLSEAAGGTMLNIRESGFDNISLARRARVLSENNQGWDDQLRNLERYLDSHVRQAS